MGQPRPPDPTPEEIEAKCREIRAEWDERRWASQCTREEMGWRPLHVSDPILVDIDRRRPKISPR